MEKIENAGEGLDVSIYTIAKTWEVLKTKNNDVENEDNDVNLEKDSEVENDDCHDENDENNDATTNFPDLFEDISTGITTEEIIKMYENVEMKDDANQISVDDILNMYETEDEFIDKSNQIY